MRVAADPERAEVELVRMLFGISDQLLEVLYRDALVQDQHLMGEGEIGDRLEILDRIVGQVLVERGIDRDAAAREQANGAAVRRRRLAGVGGDDRVRAGAAFDDEAMRIALLERLAERAHHDVDRAARSERNDDADRAGGVTGLAEGGVGDKSESADERDNS